MNCSTKIKEEGFKISYQRCPYVDHPGKIINTVWVCALFIDTHVILVIPITTKFNQRKRIIQESTRVQQISDKKKKLV